MTLIYLPSGPQRDGYQPNEKHGSQAPFSPFHPYRLGGGRFPSSIDAFQQPCENALMKTVENTMIPSDALADLEYALDLQAAG
jgi:hypothetical protein